MVLISKQELLVVLVGKLYSHLMWQIYLHLCPRQPRLPSQPILHKKNVNEYLVGKTQCRFLKTNYVSKNSISQYERVK